VAAQSIPAMLRQCVNLQPDGTAFTFIDYEQDWAAVAETLTWLQLYRRVLNVALISKRGHQLMHKV
jgi:acyl-CoA synthetase (AMP-forming)/AMP-acid ligase II